METLPTEKIPYRNDLIRAAIVNKDLTRAAFAEQSGIAITTVAKLWNGDTNIELPSIIRACDFLGISLHKMFEPKESEAVAA